MPDLGKLIAFQPQDTAQVIEEVAALFEGNTSMAVRYMIRHFGACPQARQENYSVLKSDADNGHTPEIIEGGKVVA
jgi:hypothetical protein